MKHRWRFLPLVFSTYCRKNQPTRYCRLYRIAILVGNNKVCFKLVLGQKIYCNTCKILQLLINLSRGTPIKPLQKHFLKMGVDGRTQEDIGDVSVPKIIVGCTRSTFRVQSLDMGDKVKRVLTVGCSPFIGKGR